MEAYFKKNPAFDLVEKLDTTLHTEVWKAIQTNLKRTVVLHILNPESVSDPRDREHFLAIARSFAKIKSEYVASVFDIISEDDCDYVVMEYVEGPTLDELAQQPKKLTPAQILQIGLSIASCMGQLWQSAHLIHRNLKSSVIRLDSRGIAKLVDFSLATISTSPHLQSGLDDGHIVGTPCFISPEQVQGVEALTTQSDMYALGAVLYHLATGTQPFFDPDPLVSLNAQLRGQLPPPHVLNPQMPVAFSWLIHRLMMKNPTNRYADWDALVSDIHLITANQKPSCITPQETYLSTIDIDLLLHPPVAPKKTTRTVKRATQRVSMVEKEHHAQIHREKRRMGMVAWLLLLGWFGVVFWYRAIVQNNVRPGAETTPAPQEDAQMLPQEERAPAPVAAPAEEPAPMAHPIQPPAPSPSAPDMPTQTVAAAPATPKPVAELPPATPATPPAPPPAVQQTVPKVPAAAPAVQPAGAIPAPAPAPVLAEHPSDELETQLVEAISKGDCAACLSILKTTPEKFRDKVAMLALVEKAPTVTALVESTARTLVGRPVPMLRNGRERIVTPRQVGNGVIQVEANGRTVDVPISILTADEKLSWIEPPVSPAESLSYCLLLMQTAKRTEVEKQAENCPLFKHCLQKAATLTPTP